MTHRKLDIRLVSFISYDGDSAVAARFPVQELLHPANLDDSFAAYPNWLDKVT
jgi:hypothetical protein